MTPEGFTRLRQDLEKMKTVTRPQIVEDLSTAAAQGDLSENSEYDDAKERLAILNRRIKETEDKLVRAEVIDPSKISSDRIAFGATVTLLDLETDDEVTYQIIGVDEADVKAGRISIASPIARALIGKMEGDSTRVRVPKGLREFEVMHIEFK